MSAPAKARFCGLREVGILPDGHARPYASPNVCVKLRRPADKLVLRVIGSQVAGTLR